ncbi:hypothetical protein Hte_009215 [Hypoxylon texense]
MEAVHEYDKPTYCDNSCHPSLPSNLSVFGSQYPFLEYSIVDIANITSLPRYNRSDDWEYYYGGAFRPGALDLSIKYCLAEPLDRICHVALSPTLLIGVTVCVIAKTCTAILVTVTLIRQRQTPLVTLGDAMASFIEKPDPISAGLCTFGQNDVRKASKDEHASQDLLLDARRWQPMFKRRGAVVPKSVWVTSYFLFALGIAVCGTFFGIALQSSRRIINGEPVTEGTNILPGYYGSRFIRNYDEEDRILPPGTAVAVGFSTYSLLAMLIMSCLLITIPILLSLKRLSPNMVNIGSNSFALSAACHVSKLSHAAQPPEDPITPYLTTESSLTLDYPSIAWDSAAGTRSSTNEPRTDTNLDSIETQQLIMTRQSSSRQSLATERLMGGDQVQEDDHDGSNERGLFKKLARSKIRWGVVQMLPEWYAEFEHMGMVEHLSFGVEEDNVQTPVAGRLYA